MALSDADLDAAWTKARSKNGPQWVPHFEALRAVAALVHKNGDVVAVHCCDSCARKFGATPKTPADSGKSSWLCEVCGHYGIGSLTDCEIGDWLHLRPIQPNAKVSGAGTASAGLPGYAGNNKENGNEHAGFD